MDRRRAVDPERLQMGRRTVAHVPAEPIERILAVERRHQAIDFFARVWTTGQGDGGKQERGGETRRPGAVPSSGAVDDLDVHGVESIDRPEIMLQ